MRSNPLRLALAGLAAMGAGLGIGRFVYTPILPVMAEALALSKSQAGLLASANFLGYLIGALLIAMPGLVPARRSTLLAALAVNAAGLAGMGLTHDFHIHLLLRLIGGIASAFVLVIASAMVLQKLAAAGRGSFSALHFGGVGLGIALSAAAVALLTAQGAAWDVLWFASGFIGLLALGAVAALMPDAAIAEPGGKAAAASAPAPVALYALVAAYGLFGFGYVITATFIVAIVRGTPDISPLEPYVWIVVGLSGAPSVALWLRAASIAGTLNAFSAACLVEAVGVLSSILWVSPAGILLAAALLGGTFMGITALGLMAARQLAPGMADQSIALMTAAFGAGQIVGPTFAGLLFDHTGSFLVPSVVAAVTLVVAAGLGVFAQLYRNAPFETFA